MLIIRKQQATILRDYSFREFCKWVEFYLRKQFPEQLVDLDSKNLQTDLEKWTNAAESYGIRSRDEVLRYFELMVDRGADDDGRPTDDWAREILCSKIIDPKTKMDLIDQREFSQQ